MGKTRYDQILVVDLELTTSGNKDHDEDREIIEVGISIFHTETSNIDGGASYIIKPKKAKISQYCAELTGITQEMVDGGMQFDHAMNKIVKDYKGKNRVWTSFGVGDREQLSKECREKSAQFPFSNNYFDTGALFFLKYSMKSGGLSLEKCLKHVGEEFEGSKHRADSDAFNTAKLLRKVLK